jgi:hypothetical protein
MPLKTFLLAVVVATSACSRGHPPEPEGPTLSLDLSTPGGTEPIVVTVPSGDPLYLKIADRREGHQYEASGVITMSLEWQGATPLPSRKFEPAGQRWKATVMPGDQVDILVNDHPPTGKDVLHHFVGLAPPTREPWVYPTEEAWAVAATAHDVADILFYAKNASGPAPVVTLPAGATGPRYILSIGPTATDVRTYDVDVSDQLWSLAAYESLSTSLLKSLALVPGARSAPSPILRTLASPRSDVIARESARVSEGMASSMLDPTLHEEAALVLGALALREAAGTFSDTRRTLCRITAHLAIARALRGTDTPPLLAYGEATLLTLVDRQRDALAALDRLENAEPLPGGEAWRRALRLRNTRDWRLGKNVARATLLERLELFRAYHESIGASAAMNSLAKAPMEPMSDWPRIAMSLGATVEQSHFFGEAGVLLERTEAHAVWQALNGAPLGDGKLTEALNRADQGPVEWTPEKAVPRVVPWGVWAQYFQRNICFLVSERVRFIEMSLGLPEDAGKRKGILLREWSGLDLWSTVAAEWTFGKPRQAPAKPVGDEDAHEDALARQKALPALPDGAVGRARVHTESCERVFALIRRTPQVLTAETWVHGLAGCGVPSLARDSLSRWFDPIVPRGTALLDRGRMRMLDRAENKGAKRRALLEAAYESAPFAQLPARLLVEDNTPPETVATLYAPVADYDTYALGMLSSTTKDPVSAERWHRRHAELDPNAQLDLAVFLLSQDHVLEAVTAFEAAVRDADSLAVANRVLWLVGYYCDHERVDRARTVADQVAATYAAEGLRTKAYFLERLGQYQAAEQWYLKIAERYDSWWAVDLFYIRYHERYGGERYAARATESIARTFPKGGMEHVTLASFSRPPAPANDSVIATKEDERYARFGFVKGDHLVAVNGIRVRNWLQLDCVLSFTDEQEMTGILWRNGKYLELKGPYAHDRYGKVPGGGR